MATIKIKLNTLLLNNGIIFVKRELTIRIIEQRVIITLRIKIFKG